MMSPVVPVRQRAPERLRRARRQRQGSRDRRDIYERYANGEGFKTITYTHQRAARPVAPSEARGLGPRHGVGDSQAAHLSRHRDLEQDHEARR